MFINVTKEFDMPPFKKGHEANLYIVKQYLYKIYMENSSENELYENQYFSGPKSSFKHLSKLISRQKYIKRTILPDGILCKDNEDLERTLLGCRIKNFDDSISLADLKMPLNKKLIILEELIVCVKELLDNYIYPKDLHALNVLYDGKIRIIDLDTFVTKITDDEDIDSKAKVLRALRAVLLGFIYDDYIYFAFSYYVNSLSSIESYLKEQKLNENIIKDMLKNNFDFDDAYNLINSLKK